jgi:CRP/FNR family transcriptional regulator, cyclic AMP receptor protein
MISAPPSVQLQSRQNALPPPTGETSFLIWSTEKTLSDPIETRTLVSWARNGRVTPETWVYVNHRGIWQRAVDVPEIQWFFQSNPNAQSNARGLETRRLRRLKIFAGMSDAQLERFCRFVEVKRYPFSATVVKQGDHGDAMYVILEGELAVRMRVAAEETVLATLAVGDFFGDLALFDHGPRSADVVATTSSLLLRLSGSSFDRMSREATDLATPFMRALGKSLAARIRMGNKQHGERVLTSRALE